MPTPNATKASIANAATDRLATDFPDAAMAVAAVARLIHRATILEFNAETFGAIPLRQQPRRPLICRRWLSPPAPCDIVGVVPQPDALVVRAEIYINGIQPPVTRTLELPMDLNLTQLHEVLQATFGWTDSHLHQFDIGGLAYGAPEFDKDGWSERQTFEASSVRLADFTIPYDTAITIGYEYDFGDNWTHVIKLIAAPREPGVKYPRCIAGSRAGPPEDVGGTSGYADFLEAWGDPLHEERRDMRRWVGRKFNPERFDLAEINKAIARAIRKSNGNYRFRHED